MKAIEIRERRQSPGVVVTQPRPVGIKVPLRGPRSHGQAGAEPLAVTVPHSIQDPIPVIEDTIDRISRAGCLRARTGGNEILAVLTQLVDHLCPPVEGGPGPLGQAPQALRKLSLSDPLRHMPGPIQDLAAQRPSAALFDLEDRV